MSLIGKFVDLSAHVGVYVVKTCFNLSFKLQHEFKDAFVLILVKWKS